MPGKASSKKMIKNPRRKKTRLSLLIIIFLSVLIALAFLLFSVYRPIRKKPSAVQNTTVSKSAPAFRKDGTLTIHRSQNSSPLVIDIEIADSEDERMRGLMDRLSLPDFAGMFFIFEEDEPRSFWMKNTFISLDIIYIDSDKEIVSIQKYTQPKTTFSIPSEKPAKYVLEVNAGFTDKFEVAPGDKIQILP